MNPMWTCTDCNRGIANRELLHGPHPFQKGEELLGCPYCLEVGTLRFIRPDTDIIRELPLHRTEAGYPRCSTCDGGGCYDCTDPA